VTIRYGYQTGRALAGIAALYAVVFLAFWFAQHQGDLIAASNVQNPALYPTALHCVTGYPCFYPAGYAFDLVVPLINIRQADFWQANGHHAFGWAWVLGAWISTALGWFLATLLVVGYSGLARQA
jgi:RsiW-degrading membrane proteinase PrsW (M82 family)